MTGAARSTPLVTVITPAYNVSRFIAEAVESVLQQKEAGFEYLIVDDGSTDDTAEIVDRVAAGDERVRVLSRPHAGSAAARNTALRQARGHYLAFLDGDDRWHASKLQRQLAMLRSGPIEVAGVFCWSRLISEHGQFVGLQTSRPGFYDLDRFLETFAPTRNGSSMMLRRSVFDEVGEFDESLANNVDYEMWVRIAAGSPQRRFLGAPHVLVDYRLRQGSLVHDTATHAATLKMVLDRHSPSMRRLPQGAAYVRPALFTYGRGEEEYGRRLSQRARTAGIWYLLRHSAGRRLLLWEALGPFGRSLIVGSKKRVFALIKGALRGRSRKSGAPA